MKDEQLKFEDIEVTSQGWTPTPFTSSPTNFHFICYNQHTTDHLCVLFNTDDHRFATDTVKTPSIRQPGTGIRRMTCHRSSLKNGMTRSNTKGFGRDWRRRTMLTHFHRKKISSFGLNVPTSIKNLSRWCGQSTDVLGRTWGHGKNWVPWPRL